MGAPDEAGPVDSELVLAASRSSVNGGRGGAHARPRPRCSSSSSSISGGAQGTAPNWECEESSGALGYSNGGAEGSMSEAGSSISASNVEGYS